MAYTAAGQAKAKAEVLKQADLGRDWQAEVRLARKLTGRLRP